MWSGRGRPGGLVVSEFFDKESIFCTSTLQREHMCKIILKSMHICRSYVPEKLIYVTFKCNLDLQPT